jgi:hypothetical protein
MDAQPPPHALTPPFCLHCGPGENVLRCFLILVNIGDHFALRGIFLWAGVAPGARTRLEGALGRRLLRVLLERGVGLRVLGRGSTQQPALGGEPRGRRRCQPEGPHRTQPTGCGSAHTAHTHGWNRVARVNQGRSEYGPLRVWGGLERCNVPGGCRPCGARRSQAKAHRAETGGGGACETTTSCWLTLTEPWSGTHDSCSDIIILTLPTHPHGAGERVFPSTQIHP